MKQKLQRLKGGRLSSSLFLKTFMLLALMLCSVGSAWADTYVFDQNAQRNYDGTTTTFTFGEKEIVLTCDRTDGKAQQDANDDIQKGIKYSAGKKYEFTFPTDEIVKKIVFTGFSRDNTEPSYINKINGVVRDDGNNEPGSTQFPHKQTASDDDENVMSPTGTYEVNFYTTKQNTVSFEIAGKECNLIITVVTEKKGQKFTVTYSVPELYGASVPEGTLKAKNMTTGQDIASGAEVSAGDVVEFSAWDFCGNVAQGAVPEGRMILEGWKINDGALITDNVPLSGISWWHADIKYQYTVNSDLDFKAIYQLCYNIHFDSNNGSSDKEYSYAGGTAHAYLGAEKLAAPGSGFRGNSDIVATATPASGYAFDHWEGYLKGAGDDPVWSNDNWSKENPFTFSANGSTFDYAFGNDIYLKPVFKSLGTCIGTDDLSKAWNQQNNKQEACSPNVELDKMQECTFEFDVRNGGSTEPWNSWIVSANRADNFDPGQSFFTLRPDNFVYNGWTGSNLNTLALVGGALDFEQFKRDLDGAHVTAKVSYDGEQMFVYQVIENNGRTYTYYYPYTVPSGDQNNKVYLHVGVDKSQLTNYSAVVKKAYKFNAFVNPDGAGQVVFTNEQGVEVLNHALVGTDTKVYITATANDGYVFRDWGGSGIKEYQRTFVAGYDAWNTAVSAETTEYNFTAYFNNVEDYQTNWTLKTEAGNSTGTVYYSDGTTWFKDSNDNNTFKTSNSPSEFEGAYIDNQKTPMPGMVGLLFNKNVRIAKNGGNEVLLYANTGIVKIPVKRGEIVTFNLKNDGGTRTSQVKNADGTTIDVQTTKDYKEFTIVANADGFIEILPANVNLRMWYIKKTAIRDFAFADGANIPTQPGCDDYINAPIAPNALMQPIVEAATFTWTSSSPADVAVDANTGRITVNNSFNGSVRITATMDAIKDASGNVILPAIAKSYTLTASTNKMKFADPTPREELDDAGVVVYWQKVTWDDVNNIPEGDIHYSIVSTSAKSATITEDENGDGSWSVTVVGGGATVIKASCGALSATYTLTTFGLAFPETAAIYNFNGDYTQEVPNAGSSVTYSIDQKYGAIKDVTLTMQGATIKGLPSYSDNKGGAVVVSATNGTKTVKYVLTIPYKKYTWDFYNEGVNADVKDAQALTNNHYIIGDLANGQNPKAASEVPSDATIPNDGTGVFPGQYVINNFGQVDAIKKMLNWQNTQKTADDGSVYKYWNYTFKTLQHQDKNSKKPIDYCNEPLFSYKGAVNGNNARIVSDTQGLIFNCAANSFGINDNHGAGTVDGREQDRAILIYKGGSFTIPFVKKDHYVKLHWYRHSTNAGDIFSVTNAKDLDGNLIDPNHKLRFTGSHYESKREYRGLTILQAAADGPMTITNTAPSSWIELYTVELTDEYSTELRVEYATVIGGNNDGWGGPCSSYYANGGMFDMHDNVVSVVRKTGSAGNKAYTDADIAVTSYSSLDDKTNNRAKADNCAKLPTQRVGENPIIYIGSFPGYTNGWNGWSLDVEAFPVTEDARNLKIGLQKELITRVGNRISYGVHALTNFEGTGTAHVIVRTKSGGVDGSPRYTLDQQEAYFPVGEYHPQEYPYTWDFTNYNMNVKKDADNTYSMTSSSGKQSYGGWKSANGTRKMFTIANNEDNNPTTRGIASTIPVSLPESNARRYNKFLFADGSQFTVNQGLGAAEIRETDGLRMGIGCEGTTWKDRQVSFSEDGSGFNLGEGATITVPEVDQNMYIFVRSANKPTKVDGAVDLNEAGKIESVNVTYSTFDNNVPVSLNQGDIPANVWIYKQTNEDNTDVVITPNGAVEGIGVTNYMKPMVQFKDMPRATFTTDARAERIDYHNTGFFTNHDLKAYVANGNATMNSTDANSKESENGKITLAPIVVVPAQGAALDGNRGLVLEDEVTGEGNTARPLLPLFVPACNLQDESLEQNKLIGCIEATTVPASTSTSKIYTLTNQYYDWNWAKNEVAKDSKHTVAEDASFYINRTAITSRKNSAYLKVDFPSQSNVKQIYMFFGEDDMDDNFTAIEGIELAGSEEEFQNADIYTVTGVKVAKPTQKGVYVINGKKVFVK